MLAQSNLQVSFQNVFDYAFGKLFPKLACKYYKTLVCLVRDPLTESHDLAVVHARDPDYADRANRVRSQLRWFYQDTEKDPCRIHEQKPQGDRCKHNQVGVEDVAEDPGQKIIRKSQVVARELQDTDDGKTENAIIQKARNELRPAVAFPLVDYIFAMVSLEACFIGTWEATRSIMY